MSLVFLAEQGNLPQLQFMDEDTLHWIRRNKPNFKSSTVVEKFLFSIKDDLLRFVPPESWFLRKEGIDSIHGIRHIMRVIANVLYLAQENKIVGSYLTTKALVSASLHDLRRKNDKGDEGHAQRAVNWFISNEKEVFRFFNVDLDDWDVKDIVNAILLHEIPYKQFRDRIEHKGSNKTVIDLLKSADALDRYRLPKLKWWIDDKYLVLLPSNEAKRFAYNMVVKSEINFLRTGRSVESVLTTFDKLEKNYEPR